jgi:hypothetical protein
MTAYGEPGSTFIQWKGTDVCMDLICPCGASHHFDMGFLYAYRCPACGKTYELGTEVTVTEVTDWRGALVVPDPTFADTANCEDWVLESQT